MARGTYEVDMDKVRRLALESGWSLNTLAEKAGITALRFYKWKNGVKAYPNTVKAVADALGVNVTEIIKE